MNTQLPKNSEPQVIPLPAFNDNYIWILRSGTRIAAVDPGDGAVVERYLADQRLELTTILVTHHHADHIGGIGALTARRDIPVYGPAAQSIPGVTKPVSEGDEVVLPEQGIRFQVLEVPGHTRTHIAYLAPGMLFPGDTLFSAGCGRLLGGTAAQLHSSLQRLKSLPDDTAVYCTHEYTLANLAFASTVEPGNADRDAWLEKCRTLREQDVPTLPSSIAVEKRINPFLRTDAEAVINTVTQRTGRRPADSLSCFTELRAWKDVF